MHRSEVEKAYDFGKLTTEAMDQCARTRNQFQSLALWVYDHCPDNRARSLALTNLQEAKMWAVQAVVDDPMSQES